MQKSLTLKVGRTPDNSIIAGMGHIRQVLGNYYAKLTDHGLVLHLWDLLLLFISLTSCIAVFLLATHQFYPLLTVIIGLMTTAGIVKVLKVKVAFKDERFDGKIVLILVLALVFRFPPYLYLMGGQDQGTYINISKQYELSHSLYAIDHYRETLTDAEQELYDKHGNYLMPSIQKWNRPDSEYSMVFYPLHPAWLAMFGQLFGSDNRVYSLTMFSMISIVAFYLLGYELSGKRKSAGYIAALFLALNPLHAFFSKFPVGEVVALAFTAGSFYYLAKYYTTGKEYRPQPFYLVLSALLMNCFFYTRMSSYMYLPFFYLLILGVVAFVKVSQLKTHLLIYLSMLILLFVASYRYYFTFLRPLHDLIFNSVVLKSSRRYLSFFGGTQEQNLMAAGLVLIGTLIVVCLLTKKKRTGKLFNKVEKLIPLINILIFIWLVVFTINLLAKIGFPVVEATVRNTISGLGLLTIKHLSLFVIMEYTGLLVFVTYPIYNILALSGKVKTTAPQAFLIVFVSLYLIINIVALQTTRYQYYNIRYYVSETIPYFLLLSAIFLDRACTKRRLGIFAKVTVGLTLVYFGYFSSVQFFGSEMAQLSFYKEFNKAVAKDDLILAVIKSPESKYDNNFMMYIFGPLKYYYGHHLFVLSDIDELANSDILNQRGKHKTTYLLTNERLPKSPDYALEQKVRLNYNHYNVSPGCTDHTYEFLPIQEIKQLPVPNALKCFTPPNSYYIRYKDFYLYRLRTVSTTKEAIS